MCSEMMALPVRHPGRVFFPNEISGIGKVLSTWWLLQQCAFGGAIDMNTSSMDFYNIERFGTDKLATKSRSVVLDFMDFFMPISSFFIDLYGTSMIFFAKKIVDLLGDYPGLQPDAEW